MLIATNSVKVLLAPGVVLLLPIVLTICFWWVALHGPEAKQKAVWAGYRGFGRLVLAITVADWWVVWDWHGRSDLVSMVVHNWPAGLGMPSVEALLFGAPPTVSLGIFLLLCYRVDRTILRLKWTITETLRQAWWRLVSFVIPLLMVAAGFNAIIDGRVRGFAWLLAAGVVSKVGTGFLRRAQGVKFNALKSGELRNRALSIASRMGVKLDKVYVVPAGKGHLTNAFGMSKAIALTDNLGRYLSKKQTEYVIVHELAHVRLKHGHKYFLLAIAVFSAVSILLFCLPKKASALHPLIQLVAMIGPLTALYYCSRRFEYSADREAVDFTGDPEMATRALANLQQITELPAANYRFTELFMTHPTFAHRVQAIAGSGHLPAGRFADVLEDVGVSVSSDCRRRG